MNKRLICNGCGRELLVEDGICREEYLLVDKSWGYFSEKDGVRQQFLLCEACYDTLVQGFVVPAEESEITELI